MKFFRKGVYIMNYKKYFEIWADEQAQNVFLKGLLGFMFFINAVLLISVVILATNDPFIISISDTESKIAHVSKEETQEQIKKELERAIERFVKYRHNWDSDSIQEKLEESSQFIASHFRKKFLRANQGQLKEAKKKKIKQRFYLSSDIVFDLENKKAQITGDRILIVDGFRATQPMSFRLGYEFSKRTVLNPEGVYSASV